MNNFNKTALIGYTGFVGSSLFNSGYKFTDVYNSKNIIDIMDEEYDCIVCCGMYGQKWYANLHPEEDFEQINSLLIILESVKVQKFILISTIDIYEKIDSKLDEDYIPYINYSNHPYGRNRLHAEKFVRDNYSDHLIIRLPGLFGMGLKKNIIYDYLNGTLKDLNLKSSYQWYCIDDLYKDINLILKKNLKIETINLFSQPIKNSELLTLFMKHDNNLTITEISSYQSNYDIETKYSMNGYWNNKTLIMNKIDKYIETMKTNKKE